LELGAFPVKEGVKLRAKPWYLEYSNVMVEYIPKWYLRRAKRRFKALLRESSLLLH
jgi:hypothetical protein